MKSKWIRDGLTDLIRIRDSYENRSNMFRMDRNERTWCFSDTILNEIREKTDSDILTNYTEIDHTYHQLADYLGINYEQIYLHSGSDLVIKSIFETYIEKGDKVLIQNPAYAMYSVYAKMYGAHIFEHNYDGSLSFNLTKYCSQIKELKPKMVVLENPGGYIGNSFSHNDVKGLIEIAKDCDSLVVIDEAYIDFIPQASVIDLVDTYDNLIVVRTFSKAWGLAGLRAGYAVSNELLISELFKVRPMHELTAFTAMVVEVMISHSEEILAFTEDVKRVREYFCNELEELGIKYVKSDTHFVTVCIGENYNAEDFRNKAHKKGFYVRRPFGLDMLKDWIRIGLLPMDEMKEFVVFLDSFCTGTIRS